MLARALPGELSLLFGGASQPLLAGLFKSADVAEDSSGRERRGGGARGRQGAPKSRTVALAKQFQDSLDALMSVLMRTSPHFIRCVKPNSELVDAKFDGVFIMRQLLQMGMVHVVRARKEGFAHRYAI